MDLKRYGVARWFGLVVAVLAVVTVVGVLVALVALEYLGDRRALLADRIDPATAAGLRLSGALLNQETGVRGFVLARRERFLDPYRRGRAEEASALRQLDRLLANEELAGLRAGAARVRDSAATWQRDYAEPAIRAVRNGGSRPPSALGQARFEAVRSALIDQQRRLTSARRRSRDQLQSAANRVNALVLASGLLVLAALATAAWALRRMIITPVARLAGDVREVARGEFEHPIEPSGPRDVAELARDVDGMRRRILSEVAALREAEATLIDQAQELQRSNEELEQFAYVASHDLQEPLRKVASFTQMLERRYKGRLDERADRYIAFAVDGAKRMQELINDLLEFSRVGRVKRPHEPADLQALVERAKDRLGAAVEETGAEIVADGLPTVPGDPGLLTTVLQNLIANAIKFRGDAPPRVELTATRVDGEWELTCTDNGIGVEDEYSERIFILFQRLHTRDAYDGTGIGLAMCRKIIEYHGGRMWLAPAEPGRGAQFHFTLPAGDDQETTPA